MRSEELPGDPLLDAWIEAVSDQLRRSGASNRDRRRLRAELERDLRLGLADGASIEELTSGDPGIFARELAEADGLVVSPRKNPSVTHATFVGTALAGATVGAAASLITIYPLGMRIVDNLRLTYGDQGGFAIGMHTVASLVCAAFSMFAVRWRFRDERRIWLIALTAGASLLLGGALSVAPTMAVAARLDYSSAIPVVTLEVSIVAAFCATALLLGLWLVRHVRRSAAAVA